MIDSIMIDLMSDVDVMFLNDNYMEEDLKSQRNILSTYFTKRIKLSKNRKFEISDSLRAAIEEQNERNDMPVIREKLEIKVESVKNKFRTITRIVSGIAAMAVVMISIIIILIKKKSNTKLLRKKFQTVG